MTVKLTCPDCGTVPGEPHKNECDIERCSMCGTQRVTCDCKGHVPLRSVWTGTFPLKKNVELSLRLAKDKRIDIRPSQCYHNAVQAILHCPEYERAGYIEGIAHCGFGMEHGWLELDGHIIDPTLPTDRMVYFPGLRFEGAQGLSTVLKFFKPKGTQDLPIFYRFGFGGHNSPEFRSAREAERRYSSLLIEAQSVGVFAGSKK